MRNFHINAMHALAKKHIHQGATVVDATCGNGYDSLFLYKIVCSLGGHIYSYDIQEEAISSTKQSYLFDEQYITFVNESHEQFNFSGQVSLFVYNLGYLPGGKKEITTTAASSFASVNAALLKLNSEGGIIITCYTGHKEGNYEAHRLIEFAKTLNSLEYTSSRFYCSKSPKAPFVIYVQRK